MTRALSNSRRLSMRSAIAFGLILLLLPLSASAATEFYLDPDVSGGTHVGTQANPFSSLTSSAWSAINSALAAGDVTVYCSARAAGSDTNQVWSATIGLTSKTANPTGTLTFDGHSRWNSNDTTPSWAVYSGSSRCSVLGFDAESSGHTKYNKVTIDGFVIVRTGSAKGIGICGDNWIIQHSDISHASSATGGPLVLITPTADATHEGSSSWCPASSNITIQDNTIHDSYGELIYVGGAGCNLSAATADQRALRTDNAACNGVPSHDHITIQRNTIYNCGSRASQRDCIDIKAGLTYITVRQNDISNNANDSNYRCLVSQGITANGSDQHMVIDRNFIHDCIGVDDGALAFVDSWGTPNGIEVRNNIITGTTGGYAIKVYTTQSSPGIAIYNNDFYNNASNAIQTASGSTSTVENNAMLNNNAGGAQNSFGGAVTAVHNAFGGSWGGTCTTCVSSLTSAAFTNPVTGDFTLTAGSALLDAGVTLTTFSNDYLGLTRPSSGWDIGSYERGGVSAAPSAPTGLRVVR